MIKICLRWLPNTSKKHNWNVISNRSLNVLSKEGRPIFLDATLDLTFSSHVRLWSVHTGAWCTVQRTSPFPPFRTAHPWSFCLSASTGMTPLHVNHIWTALVWVHLTPTRKLQERMSCSPEPWQQMAKREERRARCSFSAEGELLPG